MKLSSPVMHFIYDEDGLSFSFLFCVVGLGIPSLLRLDNFIIISCYVCHKNFNLQAQVRKKGNKNMI